MMTMMSKRIKQTKKRGEARGKWIAETDGGFAKIEMKAWLS